MTQTGAVAVVGTFDSKGEEHCFLKKRIEERGVPTLTINVGAKSPSPFPADYDLYQTVIRNKGPKLSGRDDAIAAVIALARGLVRDLYQRGDLYDKGDILYYSCQEKD